MAGNLERRIKAIIWETRRVMPNLRFLNGEKQGHAFPHLRKSPIKSSSSIPITLFTRSRGPPVQCSGSKSLTNIFSSVFIVFVALGLVFTFSDILADTPQYHDASNGLHLSGTVYSVSNADTLIAPFPVLKVVGEQSLDTLATIFGDLYGGWSHTLVGVDDFKPALPDKLRLCQNYPNPFNPSTVIGYELPADADISLILYNMLGQEVRKFFSGYKEAGNHKVIWDGKNNNGNSVSSGVYIYRLTSGEYARSKKLVKLDGGGSGIVLPNANPGFRALGKTVGTEQAAGDSSFTFVVSADTIETLVENGIKLYDGKVLDFYAQLKNRAPTLLQLPNQQTNEDVLPDDHIFDLRDYASDPESPDSLLFFSILSQTNPGLANFIINNNRFLDLDSLRTDGFGYSDVAVRVADADGLSDDKTFRFSVNPMTDIRGLLFGVNPDPNGANYTLDSALVSIAGILDTTRNGAYHVQIPPTDEAYLQITHSNHHPRSIYIPALADTNLVNHVVENSEDFPELYFNFLNDVFLPQHLNPSPNYTLLKWDTDSLSVWLKNPPDSAYAAYVEQAYSQDVPSFSGGTLKGYPTAIDSASAHVSVRWRPWTPPSTPYGATKIYVDSEDPTKIIRVEILLADWLTSPNVRRHTVLEEAAHSVYGCRDINNPDYEFSIFYSESFRQDLLEDVPAGIVASKLPRGYRRNQ